VRQSSDQREGNGLQAGTGPFVNPLPRREQPRSSPSGPPRLPNSTSPSRNILGIPPLVGMDDETLVAWLRPVLAHYLSDAAPTTV
jgi:hypothetical protein